LKINLPNLLVILRIALIPVFLFFFLDPAFNRIIPMAVFLIAAFSDFLDGHLARKWGTVSNFGKLMDPLADKMLVSAAMVALVYVQELSAWAVVIIICREFWVTSLRMLALEQGKEVIAASIWGKIKTVLQVIMLTVLIWGIFPGTLSIILVYLAVIATVLSAAEYTKSYKDVFKA